jgi:transcriptional regulator with XRE-family HTH domain
MELRQLRATAGLTLGEVAAALRWSASKISRIETGRISAAPHDVRVMLELYGIRGKQQDALTRIAEEALLPGWWQSQDDETVSELIGFEAEAASIRTFEALVVPGLLQTVEYAHAVLRASHPEQPPEEIERKLRLRISRQEHLVQGDPPVLWVILDEAAVRRVVGGTTVIHNQLNQLIRIATRPTITLQILTFANGEHAGMDGSFTIYTFPESADPDVVCLGNAISDDCRGGSKTVQRYALLFNYLRMAALKPDDSLDFLTGLIEESGRRIRGA